MPYSLVDSKNIPLEDKIDALFRKKTHGFFIELGANDGLNQSNTAFLEFTREWTGILIEPAMEAFKSCRRNRPKSICCHAACVSNSYQDATVSGDFDGMLMSSVAGKRLNRNPGSVVMAITLEKCLDLLAPCQSIDLLSLDTEGYELNILNGLNLEKYRPHYMIIEVYNYDFDRLVEFLRGHDYKMVENFSNYNHVDNPGWDGTHNDFLFVDTRR